MQKTVIQIDQVDFAYDENLVLEDISLNIYEGDFLGVVGPNGSGKSTLLKIILGLVHPRKGNLQVFNRSPERARHLIGYVPQHARMDETFPISVMDVVLIGRLKKAPLIGRYRKKDRLAALESMREVDITELSDRRFGALSGGQKQRVLIARALAGNPEMLLLDEPTTSIDGRVEQDIYDLLKRLNKKVTIVLVSHDLGFISTYVNRVACVNRRLTCNLTHHVTADIIDACYKSQVQMIKHECEL